MFDFFSWLLPPPSAVVGLRSDFYPFKHRDIVVAAKSLQSCPTLCDPIDSSPQGSPISGILQPRQHIKKQRHYFANKGPSSQGYGFSCGHVWM